MDRFGWLLMVVVAGFGQTGVSRSFNGTARESSGAVIPGANVKITNTATSVSQETTMNSCGVVSL
jgi:hypothetical protein